MVIRPFDGQMAERSKALVSQTREVQYHHRTGSNPVLPYTSIPSIATPRTAKISDMSYSPEKFTLGQRLAIATQAAAGGCGCFALLVMLVILAAFVVILAMLLWFLLTDGSGVLLGFGIAAVVVIGVIVWLFVAAYRNPQDWRPRD